MGASLPIFFPKFKDRLHFFGNPIFTFYGPEIPGQGLRSFIVAIECRDCSLKNLVLFKSVVLSKVAGFILPFVLNTICGNSNKI